MVKTILITGASSGIGKELATIHAEKGGDLVIVARRQDKLDELKLELESKYNVNVITIVKDLNLLFQYHQDFSQSFYAYFHIVIIRYSNNY